MAQGRQPLSLLSLGPPFETTMHVPCIFQGPSRKGSICWGSYRIVIIRLVGFIVTFQLFQKAWNLLVAQEAGHTNGTFTMQFLLQATCSQELTHGYSARIADHTPWVTLTRLT